MQRILFLDDSPERWDQVRRWCNGANVDVTWVQTAHRAIVSLKKAAIGPEFDAVMLDHDLVEEHMSGEPTDVPTGMAVVEWMVRNSHMIPRCVCIHSQALEADDMLAALIPVMIFRGNLARVRFGRDISDLIMALGTSVEEAVWNRQEAYQGYLL